MAYSDYGGYGYRNGLHVEDRSDAVITSDMTNVGSPGVYPGFVALAQGQSIDDFTVVRDKAVDGHVVLGDGPVLVSLYKQSYLQIFVLCEGGFQNIDLMTLDLPPAYVGEWDGKRYFDAHAAVQSRAEPLRLTVADHIIEAVFENTDNYYQYARLTQPDGTVWTGFSGYGVGAGLEGCDYGFSTEECVDRLAELFPRDSDTHPKGGDSEAAPFMGSAGPTDIAPNQSEPSS